MGLPQGDGLLALRDRAVIRFFLYSGARIATACKLAVSDLRQQDEEASVRISDKGKKTRKP